MKKIIFIFCLIITIAVFSVNAQNETLKSFERKGTTDGGQVRTKISSDHEKDTKRDNRYNGRDWSRLSLLIQHGETYAGMMIKLALVRGIYEGARTVDRIKAKKFFYPVDSYRGIADEIDKFYSYEGNLNIPVAEALKVITMALSRKDKTVIDRTLEKLRSSFTN